MTPSFKIAAASPISVASASVRARRFDRLESRSGAPSAGIVFAEGSAGTAMSNFHFHMLSATGRRFDLGDAPFHSMEDACAEAYQAALEIVIEMLRKREDPAACRFEIFDDAGSLIFEIAFSEILHPKKVERRNGPSHLYRSINDRFHRNKNSYKEIRTGLEETARRVSELKSSLL